MVFLTLHTLSGSCSKASIHTVLRRLYSQNAPKLTPKRPLRPAVSSRREESGSVLKWLLLVFPAGGVALGTWQWRRKEWKAQLIADLSRKTQSSPIPFPADLEELEQLEYRPLTLTGQFLHERELLIEPRPLLKKEDEVGGGGLVSSKSQSGAQVITPFKLKDRDLIIMINRGWVSRSMKEPATRSAGQVDGDVTIDAILRHNEKRPPMSPKNRPPQKQWFYKDLDEMGAATGSAPILLDATLDSTIPGGPIGGQTRVSLRDEHLSYMITWYSLAAITTYMWYVRFFKKPAIIR